MRRRRRPSPLAVTVALAVCAACAGTGNERAQIAALLQDAPADVPARFALAGDRVTAAAVPLGPGTLPPAVRLVFDAIAPGGETVFVGREWNERGDGYRLEKRYPDQPGTPVRSVFATADGVVLERWHTVPLPEVPHHVLATPLRTGPFVDEARIVSGAEAEEHWSFVVRDRTRRTFEVRVGLQGEPLGRHRELTARIGVAQ